MHGCECECKCVCVHVYTCVCECVHVCKCVHVCLCKCMFASVCVCKQVCVLCAHVGVHLSWEVRWLQGGRSPSWEGKGQQMGEHLGLGPHDPARSGIHP